MNRPIDTKQGNIKLEVYSVNLAILGCKHICFSCYILVGVKYRTLIYVSKIERC